MGLEDLGLMPRGKGMKKTLKQTIMDTSYVPTFTTLVDILLSNFWGKVDPKKLKHDFGIACQ